MILEPVCRLLCRVCSLFAAKNRLPTENLGKEMGKNVVGGHGRDSTMAIKLIN